MVYVFSMDERSRLRSSPKQEQLMRFEHQPTTDEKTLRTPQA